VWAGFTARLRHIATTSYTRADLADRRGPRLAARRNHGDRAFVAIANARHLRDDTGVRKNGKKLEPFMPYESFAKFDDVERRSPWAFLQSIAPTSFGQR